MAPVLKTGVPERVSGVRIPPLPPFSHQRCSISADTGRKQLKFPKTRLIHRHSPLLENLVFVETTRWLFAILSVSRLWMRSVEATPYPPARLYIRCLLVTDSAPPASSCSMTLAAITSLAVCALGGVRGKGCDVVGGGSDVAAHGEGSSVFDGPTPAGAAGAGGGLLPRETER